MRILTKTTVTGDAKQVIGILAWAKDAGLQVATVAVGACRVELHRGGAPGQERTEDSAPRESIYGQFGGPALADAIGEIPAGELQPVIGRSR